jgi:oligoribonuclease NrnB/cAMP/cGMP phosphodiesterase (DHH superfamily)
LEQKKKFLRNSVLRLKLRNEEFDYRKKTRTSRRKINELLNTSRKFYTHTTHKVTQQANITLESLSN